MHQNTIANLQQCLTAAAVGIGCMLIAVQVLARLPVPEPRCVRNQFLASVSVGLCLCLAYYYWLWTNGTGGFAYADDAAYHEYGVVFAKRPGWTPSDASEIYQNPAFATWTVWIYKLFGPNTLVVRVLNVVAAGLSLWPVAWLAGTVRRPDVTRAAVRAMAWMPSLTLISILHFKDVIVGLAVLVSMAMLIIPVARWLRTVVALLALTCLWFLRVDLVIPLGVVAAVYMALKNRHSRVPMAPALVAIAVAVLVVWVMPAYKDTWFGAAADQMDSRDDLNSFLARANRGSEDAGAVQVLAIRSLADMWKLPLTMMAVLFIPFPSTFSFSALHTSVAGLANIPFILSIPFLVLGSYRAVRTHPHRLFPVYSTAIVVVALIAVVGLGVTRYKECLVGFFCVLIAVGWTERAQHRTLLALCYLLLTLALSGYVVLAR